MGLIMISGAPKCWEEETVAKASTGCFQRTPTFSKRWKKPFTR